MAEAKKASVPSMMEAIMATSSLIDTLIKEDTNTYGGYNYVPIDDYYATVPDEAAGQGLVWRCTCTAISMLGDKHVLYDFRFAMHHIPSGESDPAWQDIPIIHPLQGAQTTGSAMSYAEKLMMRTTFKIVTGEKDADANDNRNDTIAAVPQHPVLPPAVMPQPQQPIMNVPDAPATTGGTSPEVPEGWTEQPTDLSQTLTVTKGLTRKEWEIVQNGMKLFIPNHGQAEELNSYWRNNKVLLSNMKDEALDLYEDLLAAFKAHKATL